MKKTLLSCLTLALMLCAGNKAWAIEPDSEGVYRIGTADELEEFAVLTETDNAVNAVLTADIDYTGKSAIVGASAGYAGIFDGAGHKVTVDVHHTDADRGGLFGKISGTVKNMELAGSVESTNKGLGGIGSHLSKGGKLINCVMSATITSNFDYNTDGKGDGTIGGLVARIEGGDNLLLNCVNRGKYVGPKGASRFGGFVGWCGDGNHVDATNCLQIADISELSETADGAHSNFTNGETFIRRANSGCVTLTNCYYRDVINTKADPGTQITDEQLASGEVAFLLNGDQSTIAWYQTIGTDAAPVPFEGHSQVYMNGRMHCDGSPYAEGSSFSNTNTGLTKDEHDIQNGKCSYCGLTQEDFVKQDEQGNYLLGDAAQMAWFAAFVNGGNTTANAIITAPIDMEGVEVLPIGSVEKPYAGTFDGQLMPITNASNMIFGTTDGANITGIALVSGDIAGNGDYAARTGTIIGQGKKSTLTRSYSKASLASNVGDLGGLAGKFTGSIKDCAFAGTFFTGLSEWTQGGLVGSSDGGSSLEIHDCIMIGNVATEGGSAKGSLVGWLHENCPIDNCLIIADCGMDKTWGDGASSSKVNDNCLTLTSEEFNSGMATWLLNHETFVNANWYQTIGDDEFPVLDNTHGLVYKTADGYACGSADNFEEMSKALLAEGYEYSENAIASQATRNAYKEALDAMAGITDREAFVEAFTAAAELRKAIDSSAAAYAAYSETAQNTLAAAQESGIGGELMSLLIDYMSDTTEPNEDFANGSYAYIMETLELDNDQLAEETAFVIAMLENAIKNGYKVGDEITNLLTNATLADGFNGWTYTKSGSTFVAGGVKEVMPAAESWQATFDMNQTLTGLTDGIYELQVNANFRPLNDIYSPDNYAAFLYANGNQTYVMDQNEDVVTLENAQDLVNCYITEGASNTDNLYETEALTGYVPYGPLSCSYAFAGGRYVNTILAYVNDGKLTVGLRNPGTGYTDWCGFGNFRLFYCGGLDTEEATAALDRTLAGQIARANTVLNYVGWNDERAAEAPEFPASLRQDLRDAIAAVETANNEEKLALVARFGEIFQKIYDDKKAYAEMYTQLAKANSAAWAQASNNPDLAPLMKEVSEVYANMMDKWMAGAYSAEEALAMDEWKQTAYYNYKPEGAPDCKGGVYQISNVQELMWVANYINSGMSETEFEITAPIDLAEVEEWIPIGSIEFPFTGSVDGHLMPITNINGPFIGTASGATMTQIFLASGTSFRVESAAEHTGTIVAHADPKAPSTLTKSISAVNISSASGDLGGLSGKFYGTIEDCAFLGTIENGPWTTGGLIGSSSESATPAHLKNCFVFSDHIAGGEAQSNFVAWLHSNCSIDNCWAISDIDVLTYHADSPVTNSGNATKDQFASGEITVKLNGDRTGDNTVWFQTLGEDQHPVLDGSHMIVVVGEDGSYTNVNGSGVASIESMPAQVNVYDMQGRLVRANVNREGSLQNLPKGLYIIGGRKVLK